MKKVRIAIVGVGNCATSLVQAIEFYRQNTDHFGLINKEIGGYRVGDIKVVAAFDVNSGKIGRDLSAAMEAAPNCTTIYHGVPYQGVTVRAGILSDGISGVLADSVQVDDSCRWRSRSEIVAILKEAEADVVVSYLPVGSVEDSKTYAEAALEARAAFVNCTPSVIASDPEWVARFEAAGVPLIGDDIKSQFGATALHRHILAMLLERGAKIDKTYQLNFGGNTDFLNMSDRARAATKKYSKTNAITEMLGPDARVSVGPSDYVHFLNDRKVCYLRIEGQGCLGMKFDIETRLEVEDSPNSAGVVLDAVRLAKLAADRGEISDLPVLSSYFFKKPLRMVDEAESHRLLQVFFSKYPSQLNSRSE